MIIFAKFFQHVEIPTGKTSKTPSHMAAYPDHEIVIDGPFVRITHRASGTRITATVNNLSYFREDNDTVDESTAPATKKPGKPKREQDPVV